MSRSTLLSCCALSMVVAVVSMQVPRVHAATFYVAPPPSGDDAHPGTLAEPWATLQHAADTVAPGDEVLIRDGAYAGMHLTTSGTMALPIAFRAFPGEQPEVVADNAVTPDGINLEGASWIEVEGFRVDQRTRAGIRAVLCQHVTLRGNRLDGNGRWGIFTGFCDDLLIEDNLTTGSVLEHGIYVSNSGDRPVIRDNTIHGNFANGIHMNGDVSQGGDGVISDALVEANVIFDNGTGGGSAINCDGVQDSLIRNNLIYDTHASGISLYRIDGGAPSAGNRVFNNTILVADDGRWAINIRDASTSNHLSNNILYSEHSFRGAMSIDQDSLTGLVSDHNAIEDRVTTDDGDSTLTLAEWSSLTGQDTNSFTATPAELVDPTTNFRPLETSPALDAGEALTAVPTDIIGTPRPIGPAYDIGCYEGSDVLFANGFETGEASAWSAIAP